MPSSYTESNRLHSSNMRKDAADAELDAFLTDEADAEAATAEVACEFNQFWGNRCINPSKIHAAKYHC